MLNVMDDRKGHLDVLLAGSLAVVVVCIYAMFDVLAAVSLDIRFNLITLTLLLIVGALLLRKRSNQHRLWWALLAALVLFTISRIDWNTRKPFLRDLNSIQIGMSEGDVEAIMSDYMKVDRELANPPTQVPSPQDIFTPEILVYRHTNQSWGDSDWGIVTLEEGKVVEVDFSPD